MANRWFAHVLACAWVPVACAPHAFAHDAQTSAGGSGSTSVEAEYQKRIKANEDIAPLGADLLGDSVSLYNGTLSFAATDVSLPGNFALPVSIGRRYAVGSLSTAGHFGDWELDIPHLSARLALTKISTCGQGSTPASSTQRA